MTFKPLSIDSPKYGECYLDTRDDEIVMIVNGSPFGESVVFVLRGVDGGTAQPGGTTLRDIDEEWGLLNDAAE